MGRVFLQGCTLSPVTLRKTIEFPLFHVGQFTSQDGSQVPITDALLRQIEKNTNFILKSKVLQAPIGYDHPAKDSHAHGTLVGTRYHGGVLYAQGTDWSDALVADVKASKRLAYSGELHPKFSYPAGDGSGKMIEVGPAVVGLAILGSQRPAIKNLKPLSEFEFAEGTAPADAFETREELRSAGLVSQHVDGHQFFGEVENDARRFFSEEKDDDTMDEKEFQRRIDEQEKKWSERFDTFKADAEKKIQSFSEESKRAAEIDEYCSTVGKEKPMGVIALGNLRKALTAPTVENIKAFAESLPAFIAPGGMAGKKNADGTPADEEEAPEPKSLASVRVKHFADRSKNETLLAQAVADLEKIQPKLFSEAKATTLEQRIAVTKQYVVEREAAAN